MAKLAANIIIESRKHLEDNEGKIYTAISLTLHLILFASIAFSSLYLATKEALKPKVYRVSIATIPTSGNQGLKDRTNQSKTVTPVQEKTTIPKPIKKTMAKKPKTNEKKNINKKTVGINTKKVEKHEKILKEESAIPQSKDTNTNKTKTNSQNANERVGFSQETSSNFDLGSVNFEYSYYLAILKEKVGSNWVRNYIGEGKVKVYFQIKKNGSISDAIIEESSGNVGLDKLALRAVLNSSPLPPLPEGYSGDKLGIHLWFNHEE